MHAIPSEAVHAFSELELWQIEQTLQAISEADSGEFAAVNELKAVLSKYDSQTL